MIKAPCYIQMALNIFFVFNMCVLLVYWTKALLDEKKQVIQTYRMPNIGYE